MEKQELCCSYYDCGVCTYRNSAEGGCGSPELGISPCRWTPVFIEHVIDLRMAEEKTTGQAENLITDDIKKSLDCVECKYFISATAEGVRCSVAELEKRIDELESDKKRLYKEFDELALDNEKLTTDHMIDSIKYSMESQIKKLTADNAALMSTVNQQGAQLSQGITIELPDLTTAQLEHLQNLIKGENNR